MEQKRTCPECNLIFTAPAPESGLLTCPLCDTVFAAHAPAIFMAPAPDPTPPQQSAETPAPAASARHVLKGCLAIGALLVLAGGLAYAYRLIGSIESGTASAPPPKVEPPPAAEPPPALDPPPPLVEIVPIRPLAPAPQPQHVRAFVPHRIVAPQRSPSPPEPTRPLTLTERVNQAIDRGTAYLREHHGRHDQYRPYLGLLGLTMLECGAAPDDPAVKQIAAWLHAREKDLANTYELTLAILFLDRRNEAGDRPLLRIFGQRLLHGQLDGGTWTYTCPVQDTRRRGTGSSPLLQQQSIMPWQKAPGFSTPSQRFPFIYHGDNSNTQFAILGLWVAQRHGVAARQALLMNEQYFRQTQATDGSWGYHPNLANNRDSMTCAGLMSLAMRYGAINGQGRDIRPGQPVQVSDRAVVQGLRFLGQALDRISLDRRRIVGVQARDPLYFLWSLERMAVIYDLKTIGTREWYPWAAEMLVQTQQADGSWHGPYHSPVGTCFALLILKRSNVAHDLHLTIQGASPQREPGLSGPAILQGTDSLQGSPTRDRSITPPRGLGPTMIQEPGTRLGGSR
jgi:hypothetical protein